MADTRRVAKLLEIVIDCAHPASLARFWAAALDGYGVAHYDETEIDRLRALGIFDLEDDPTVLVEGPGPRLFLQRVPERRQVKNRVHLDLAAADLDSEVKRLVSLGASVVETYDSHVWLADPQGNDFCVTRATTP
jgi:Glyoxalase-like domain